MSHVLVVDDDRTVLRLVEKAFEGRQVAVTGLRDGEHVAETLAAEPVDVLLLDIHLPGVSGLDVARTVRERDPKLPIIFITVSDTSQMAIEAMKLGAYDFLVKPLDLTQVEELVDRALETRRLMQAPVVMADQEAEQGDSNRDMLIGRSAPMMEVYKQIGRVAAQNVTVLITGESGTGKELVARAIYQHSHRQDRYFLAVNCAALSQNLLESELFGHEKGAFTGADRQHIGKFERCDGGTIFLDEIGDMAPETQAKVLRLLQEQAFERVGGRETIRTDVRIISATNRNLEQMVQDGEFRLDLYHRLNSFEINVPPLRERADDLDRLVEYFLSRFNAALNKKITGLSDDAMERLKQYPWPGNVRELQGVCASRC